MCEVDEKEYMPMWWASVPAELYKLRAEGRLCDITIVVGGVLRYSVHSLVLVSASSHFKASLNAGSLLQEYYLQDADEDCFKHLMDYIYGRNLVLNKDNVHAILSTAKALYIDSAILHCEEYSKSLPHREQMDSSDSQQSCKLTNKGSGTNPSPGFNNSLQLDTSTSFSSDFLPGYDVDTQRVLERGIKQEPENLYPGENTADTKNNAHVTYEPITVGGKTVAMRSVVHESSSASKPQSHGNKFGNSPPDADKPKNKSLEFICAQLSSKRNINGQVESDILENDIDDSFSPNSSFSPIRHASDFPWQHQHLGTNMRFGTCSHLKSTPVRYSELPTSLIRREKDKSKYISTILNLRSQNSSPESMSRPFPTSSRNSIDSTNAVWSTEVAPSIVVSSSMSASNILQSTINSCNSGGVSNVEAATSATMPLVGNVGQVSGTNTTNVNTLSAATNALLSSVANQQAALQSLMLNMSGGTLPGLPGLLPFGLGGNLGSNSTSQPLASHSGIGLGNFNSQFSNQLPSQALQCLSALTANAQALGQLLPPLPTGILPSQMMHSQMAITNESQTLAPLSTANASNQTQDSTQSTESSHVNVPDSSTESCAAATSQQPPPAEEENPSSSNSNSDDITPGQSTALPGIFGLNPSETSAAAINQTLQQQGLPSLMLPPAGQNLINVNMAGVNPVLPMALFMLPNGGLGPNLMLPSSQSFTQAGLKQESDHPADDDGDNDMDIRIRQNHSGSSITMFDCPICHKPFPNTKQRAVHMRIHSKYEHKPFVCDVCGFRTKYADRLRIHKRLQHTHKGIKPFKCPYCPYATSLKGNCRKHVMNKHPSCAVMVEQVMPI